MDHQWQQHQQTPVGQHQPYTDATGNPARRQNGTAQSPRDYVPQQHQQHHPPPPSSAASAPGTAPVGYKYDQYHGGAPINTALPASAGASITASPMSAGGLRDGNGDVAMHDARDSRGGMSYPMRPHHQSQLSTGRIATLHSPQEPSAAAQRYSPMEALSPTSPYAPQNAQYGGPSSQRQSPTKPGEYPTSPFYPGRSQNQQLPPMSPYTSAPDGYASSAVANFDGQFNDPKSPRRHAAPAMPPHKAPVPEFRKVRALNELRPKNSQQPPFRRANPEGGFISVRFPNYLSCDGI